MSESRLDMFILVRETMFHLADTELRRELE
jgi:hypothetical protein